MSVNWRLYVAAAAGLAAAFVLPYWYTQILPRPYINTLSAVTQDYAVAEAAYERLRRWPGHGARADDLLADVMVRRSERTTTVTEALAAAAAIQALPGKAELAAEMMAKFWLRQATAAMHRGDRDVALIHAIEARGAAEDISIETVSELIGADYPFLERTFRLPQPPISWDVDWERNELVIVDPAHRVERLPLAAVAAQRSIDAEAEGRVPGRLTAIQLVPVTRELRVDEEGTAGAFNLLITTQHPRASDLILTLTAPSGAQATLPVPQPRVDQHELIFSARGDSPLTELVDEETLGQWQLTLVDRRSGEAGELATWGLQFRADRPPWQDAPEQGVPLPDPTRTEQVDIALSRAGRIAVALPTRAGAEGALAVWDLRSGEHINDLPIRARIGNIVISAATDRILAVAGGELTVWNIASEDPVARHVSDSRFVLQPALSSDEQFAMIAEAVPRSAPSFSLLQLASGELLTTFDGVDGVTDWMLGPNARFLAVLDGSRRARIFDPRSGEALAELRHYQNLARLVAAEDDTLVTVDTDGSVHSWPIGTAGEIPVLRENRLIGSTVDPASVSLATDVLAFALADGLVVVQDLHDARRPQYFRAHSADRASMTRVAPRARRLITASGSLFRLWRLEPRPPGATMERELSAVALDRGGEVAAFGFRGGHVRVRRLSELGHAPAGAENVDYIGHRGMVTSLAVNAARNVVASGGSDGVVRVWNLATVAPSPHFLRHPIGPVNAVSISADGTRIASAAEYSARLWQAQTGQLISEVPVDGAALSVAFSPDAELVAIGDTAGNIFFGEPSGTGPLLSARAQAAVTALAISPDSARMVSGDDAGNLQLWDTVASETATATYLFQEPVSWVDFSRDGSAIYARSGGWAHELRMSTDGLSVVASHLLPIGVGAGAMPAVIGSDSIRWLAGPTINEPSYADLPMRSAAATALAASSPQLSRDWPSILGLELDRGTGTVRLAR
jgi:WD40 repeat protein